MENNSNNLKPKISRKNFLKTAGAIALGFLIGNDVNFQQTSLSASVRASLLPQDSNPPGPRLPYNYIVYNKGATDSPKYYVQRSSDSRQLIENGSSSADLAIQLALDQEVTRNTNKVKGPGHIFVCSGQYKLSNEFHGFKPRSNTRLTLDPTASIIVPNGYSSIVFNLQANAIAAVSHCLIEGGVIIEDNSQVDAKRHWTAFCLEDLSEGPMPTGVYFNNLVSTNIIDAGIGIKLIVRDTHGFVNANGFECMKMSNNNIFIDFEMSPITESSYVVGTEQFGIHRNYFNSIQCQSGKNTTNGVKDIRHVGNIFLNVNVWDIHEAGVNASSSNIHQHSSNSMIIGGAMTNQNFSNNGKDTMILDQWQGLTIGETEINNKMKFISDRGNLGFFGNGPVPQYKYNTKLSKLDNMYNAMKSYGLLGT